MRERSPNPGLSIALPVLLLASLACRMDIGGPQAPGQPPAASALTATQAAQSWSSALEGAMVSGQLTILVTEEQLTSALAARVAQDETPTLTSPAVYLRDGQIQIFGEAAQGPVQMTLRLEITPIIDSQGRLGFEVSSADLGPFPAPRGLRDGLSAMLSEALAGSMGSLATGFRITSVAVADGQLAIVAELR